jgi:hypothetical protein
MKCQTTKKKGGKDLPREQTHKIPSIATLVVGAIGCWLLVVQVANSESSIAYVYRV